MTNPAATPLSLSATILEKINFACHQSAFAVLRELRVIHAGEQDLEDLELTVSSSPAFLKPKSWRIDRLVAGTELPVRDKDLQLDGGFLLGLSESMKGEVIFRLSHQGEPLLEQSLPVELLANNEWGGNGYMPELLAAFCIPNDPVVDRLLGQASQVLRKAGKPDSINGYESNSRERVWLLVSAIYSAVIGKQIAYALPPSSFESNGQKIRLPGKIDDSKLATCLDSTLLFAAAFEQAGLNPLVVLIKGHALVGVWLEPEDLATLMITDAEVLRQRLPLKELILIETTLSVQHPPVPFSVAVATGAKAVALDKDDDFIAAIDIRRARSHGIKPLSLVGDAGPDVGTPVQDAGMEPALEDAPDLPPANRQPDIEAVPETPAGRLERWQRKLLDLSARNPLLNHKTGKSSLVFVGADPAQLEDLLAAGEKISIAAFPKLHAEGQDEELYLQRHGDDLRQRYARDALAKKQLLVAVSAEELDRSAVEIYRKAQTSLKEGGSNTLFLAIGFLLWRGAEKDARRYRAPLILLPVVLERKSVRSGIRMTASDDEPRFNTTLLEMLKKDFGLEIQGLDGALPQDASGVDVTGIWNRIRQAIKNIPGFEVTEEVVLGHFSFAKYLMWKDLVDRAAELRENAVVRHLLDTPREAYASDIRFVDRSELDNQYSPADLLTPLPADSSQMAAIATADRGKDFVIIGPPGTGKSQTIGNLIAHMLGKGKRVLFVSEKTAALEVVHRRLKDIGLGSFCLELHSNKAKKADVLDQLRSSWAQASRVTVAEWQEEAERLKVLRDRLNRFVTTLHRPRRNGLTPHYAIGLKVRDSSLASEVRLSWPHADQHSAEQLQQLREIAERLQVQASALGRVDNHPLQGIGRTEWRPQWQEQLISVADQLAAKIGDLQQLITAFEQTLGVGVGIRSLSKLQALDEFGLVLLDSWRQHPSFALEPDGPDRLEALEQVVLLLKNYIQLQSRLSCPYEPLAWQTLDADQLAQQWQSATNTWWPKAWFARRALLKVVQAGGAKGLPDLDKDIPVLRELRQTGDRIGELERILGNLKGWNSYQTDPDAMVALQLLGARAREAVSKLADDAEAVIALRSRVRSLMYDANDLLAPDARIGMVVGQFRQGVSQFHALLQQFESLAGQAVSTDDPAVLGWLAERCRQIVQHQNSLKDWCGWSRRRTEALAHQLGPLVTAIEQGRVGIGDIPAVFEAAYCQWWSAAVIGEDEILRTFSSPEHEADIERFRALDGEFSQLTARYIAARLAGQIPDENTVTRSSSWGVLRHELQKKSRHKPVREMMDVIPDAITTLAPCLMMSPLSIAQFLSVKQALFDVVIFDEASQITVWDAVGSIARGKQVIVAGDPRQMPPTSFFARADNNQDGDIDDEGDLESILDELIGASVPQQVLNLHYRSRRESLIAFSNNRYYDSSLITFPAPVHPDRGVSIVHPHGSYARGKARNNPGEARAIVAEILRRLTSADEQIRKQSIGVVTFNTEQQGLIEDLLDKARADDPSIEWAFSEESTLEPVFVKNLESVQGDERDVILFSITYGPDESGHVAMNFGPLNRTGGERRLNVAMTRARSEMQVFSTLRPEQIDLSRTAARAVADLKHFLAYAERGAAALGAAVHGSVGDFESPFEIAVATALQEKGWIVHPQIGVSAYRIDIGILHPDWPGLYLAGIECDGAMYHSSAYARERDKIRQKVLEGLGWKLLRVWSTNWWVNKAEEVERLDARLQQLLEHSRLQNAQRLQETPSSALLEHGVEPVENADDSSTGNEGKSVSGASEHAVLAKAVVPATATPVDADRSGYICVYHAADLDGFRVDPHLFYEAAYDATLAAIVDAVIEAEGPIHEHLLLIRVARLHSFARVGNQIRARVLGFANNGHRVSVDSAGTFFWPRQDAQGHKQFARIKQRPDDARKVEWICDEELGHIARMNGIKEPCEVARILGMKFTAKVRERLEAVLAVSSEE